MSLTGETKRTRFSKEAVRKTGKKPYHYTAKLPREVTQQTADRFNSLFGRR